MNTVAYAERVNNKRFIQAFTGAPVESHFAVHLLVDGSKATYNGTPFWSLSGYNKRKFENRLIIEYAPQKVSINYI